MYSTFGSNKPLVLLLLLVPALVLAWVAHHHVAAPNFPIGGELFQFLDSFFIAWPTGRLWIGMALMLTLAVLTAQVCNVYHLHRRENYFTALICFLFLSIHLSWIYFNPIVLGSVFLLLTLMRTLSLFRSERVTVRLYDSGFFMGIAILIFPPFLLVSPILLIALSMLRPFNIREFLVPFSGLLTPILGLAFYHFWFATIPDLQAYSSFGGNLWQNASSDAGALTLTFLVISLVVGALGFAAYMGEMSASTVQRKNTKGVLIVFSALCIATWVYCNSLSVGLDEFGSLLAIPLAVFGGYAFSNSERPILAVISYYAWLLVALLFGSRAFFM